MVASSDRSNSCLPYASVRVETNQMAQATADCVLNNLGFDFDLSQLITLAVFVLDWLQ